MKKIMTKLAVLALGAASVMGVSSSDVGSIRASAATEYVKLTSIANIDSTAQYVLGLSAADGGELFHYLTSGDWGKTAATTSQKPFYYTLTIDEGGTTFHAYVTTDDVQDYLYLNKNSNKFNMGTNPNGTSTNIVGVLTLTEEGYISTTGTTRVLRNNGGSGIRSYSSPTGTPVFFYEVKTTGGGTQTPADEAAAFMAQIQELLDKVTYAIPTDGEKIEMIIREYNGEGTSPLSADAKKEIDDNPGIYDYQNKIDELQLKYNKYVADDLWKRIEALLPSAVTQSDEATINEFKTEYAALNEAQQGIIDGYGYVEAMAALDDALTAAFVGPVEALIEALPEASAITSEADWSLYDAAVTEAKTAYDALGTRQENVNQTLVQKLNDVITAMEAVKPALVVAMYKFSATANTAAGVVYPTGWTGTLEGYYGSLASYKAKGEYTQMDSLLDDNVKSISNLMVTVYAATNSATKASTLTVYGLNNGEIISGCSVDITPVYKEVSTAANATTAANENPRVVSLNSETLINGIRVECTTKGGNVALIGISVSYVEERYSAEYISLVNAITEANTCTAYVNAALYREQYNALADDEKAAFDAKVISDNDLDGNVVSVTCGEKLAYMEFLLKNPPQQETPGSSVLNNTREQTPITLIVLVAVLGLSAVAAYYFINKKKQQA